MLIQSARLSLRPVRASDIDRLYRIYGDPATNTFNPAGPHPDIDHSRKVLAQWLAHQQTHGFGNWAIAAREAPQNILGFGGLAIVHCDNITINNLGYRFAVEAWGKGFASEFARTAIAWGFAELKLAEISARVRKNHLASQKVLIKAGMSYVREIYDVPDAPPSLLFSLTRERQAQQLAAAAIAPRATPPDAS